MEECDTMKYQCSGVEYFQRTVIHFLRSSIGRSWLPFHPPAAVRNLPPPYQHHKSHPCVLVRGILYRVNTCPYKGRIGQHTCSPRTGSLCSVQTWPVWWRRRGRNRAVAPAAAVLRDYVGSYVSGISVTAPMGTAFNGLYSFAQKNSQKGIIWTSLIYYARHTILNKQKGKPQAASFSSYKGFPSVSWVECANVVDSVKGCSA